MITFTQWQKDRQQPGTFSSTVRAIYGVGSSYQDAMEDFRICYLMEAILDCHGSAALAAAELAMSRKTIFARLGKSGFSVKDIRGMHKEPAGKKR